MRFIETTHEAVGEELYSDYPTKWWFDTERPLPLSEQTDTQKFRAVETEPDKDPNNFVKHEKLYNLFNDQAEYYHVCQDCYLTFRSIQWCGYTKMNNWKQKSGKDLEYHTLKKGWCEFCDPIFGNGGWQI